MLNEGGPIESGPKEYSVEEMVKIHQLVNKVSDLIGWDLGSMCSSTEELDVVHKAQDGMNEIADILKVPKRPNWFDKKVEENPPVEGQKISEDVFAKIKQDLDQIEEILDWDLAAHCSDETDLRVVREAEQAYEELREIL